MIYLYLCNNCDNSFDVIKPVSQYNSDEKCPACYSLDTKKQITAPYHSIKNADFQVGYSPAFGKKFTNYRQQEEAIRKINYEHGTDIQPVGSDILREQKPEKTNFNNREIIEMARHEQSKLDRMNKTDKRLMHIKEHEEKQKDLAAIKRIEGGDK